MKICTIVGARPQFVKAAVVSRELQRSGLEEIIIHTGQHFDHNMSKLFFDDLSIPKPHYNLDINGMSHGAMTGKMLEEIEKVLLKEQPDIVLVYGDTNSTLAGALAAKKLDIKIAHVEAGLRSFNSKMPEETNRIVTDRISDLLFCPSQTAVKNLEQEGFTNFESRIVLSGDVMRDAATFYDDKSKMPAFEVPEKFILATIHRAENTGNRQRLREIITALNEISREVEIVMPLHPGTAAVITREGLEVKFRMTEPVGYLEMVYLLQKCALVMTDSGGLQKEAYFFSKPCITLRTETEWTELVDHGLNIVAGYLKSNIIRSYQETLSSFQNYEVDLYGTGGAGKKIVTELVNYC